MTPPPKNPAAVALGKMDRLLSLPLSDPNTKPNKPNKKNTTMKILNTTTGQIEELTHSGYDCDCVPDLIADDSTITWNEDKEIKQGSEESIDWWRTYLAADAEYMDAKAELVENLDEDQKEELESLLNDAMLCDMEDQPSAGMRVIAEWIAVEHKPSALVESEVTVTETGTEAEIVEIHPDGDISVRFGDGEEDSYSLSESDA